VADRFHREYLLRLPLPLAQLYSRAYNAKDARGRHDNTFYLFEATIKLAAAPLVAAYLREIDQGQPRLAELDRQLVQLVLPSLGQWVGLLRELARHFGSRPDAAAHPLGHLWNQLSAVRRNAPGLLALYRRIKAGADGQVAGDQSCSILQVLEAVVLYRNGVFGHGGARFDAFYEKEMGPLLFPAVDELLEEGVFDAIGLAGARLVSLTQMRTLDDRSVEVSLRELSGLQGERAAPLVLGREESAALAPNTVAVLWPGWKLPLRLDPLLSYRESEVADELLFLNRDRNGKQVEYLSYTTGRTERDASMAPAMAALMQRITGAAVTVDHLQNLAEQTLGQTPAVEGLLGAAPAPQRILGDYEIIAEIGRGGMGVVYLARQLSLGRLVALKMLPSDLAGDDAALARFRREMRWLARCEHPNIVKILSSGTMPDGQLYYTMEYVPGCDLEQVWRELSGAGRGHGAAVTSLGDTTFSRAVVTASRKKRPRSEKTAPDAAAPAPATPAATAPELSVQLPPLPELPEGEGQAGTYARKVVALIRDAAAALQVVHDQKVVHRDIKPANLMLTPDGSRVVLMDFGLAKGQSMSLAASRQGGFLGTLRYAAPEQLAAATLKVGPAADVRGLGVVLWELLTRKRLFAEAEDERQLAAMVHDQDVPRLRAVDDSFDADLEAIVARATERGVSDRIGSAGRMAEYLGLWLAGRPLPIRPPGAGEVLRRWVRAHRTLVLGVAAALVAAAIGITVAFVLVSRAKNLAVANQKIAQAQKALADRRSQDMGRLALSFIDRLDELDSAVAKLAGATPARRTLAETARKYLDNLTADAGGDPAFLLAVADAYQKVGDIHGKPNYPKVGDVQQALDSYNASLDILEKLGAADPANDAILRGLAAGYLGRAGVHDAMGQPDASLDDLRRNLQIRQKLAASHPTDPSDQLHLAKAFQAIGDGLDHVGSYAEALQNYQQYKDIARAMIDAKYPNPEDAWLALRALSVADERIGDAQLSMGQAAQALTNYQQTLDIRNERLRVKPDDADIQRAKLISYYRLGDALAAMGSADRALDQYQQGLSMAVALAAADSTNTEAQRDANIGHANLGDAHLLLRHGQQALLEYQQALEGARKRAAADTKDAAAELELSRCLHGVGDALAQLGRGVEAAIFYCRPSLALAQGLVDASPKDNRSLMNLAFAHMRLGHALTCMANQSDMPAADRKTAWRQAATELAAAADIVARMRDQHTFDGTYEPFFATLGTDVQRARQGALLFDASTRPSTLPAQ
jgi:serine/threonine protein kinase/tetratricopeptide (TPR) repeat protein